MRVFNISKKVWLRGETAQKSYLLRPTDQKMCCIGQVLEQLGCDKGTQLLSKKAMSWLDHPQIRGTDMNENVLQGRIYDINDIPNKYKRPWDRIRALNRALARVGANWRMRLVP